MAPKRITGRRICCENRPALNRWQMPAVARKSRKFTLAQARFASIFSAFLCRRPQSRYGTFRVLRQPEQAAEACPSGAWNGRGLEAHAARASRMLHWLPAHHHGGRPRPGPPQPASEADDRPGQITAFGRPRPHATPGHPNGRPRQTRKMRFAKRRSRRARDAQATEQGHRSPTRALDRRASAPPESDE